MTIDELALKLATFYHEGQMRENGVPYITHPTEVARIAIESLGPLTTPKGIPVIKAIAYLHDVLEDCAEKGVTKESLKESFAGFEFASIVIDSVVALTKAPKEPSYFEYLKRVKAEPFARVVKLADISHNLSDLPPGKRRDKYLLAQYYLLN